MTNKSRQTVQAATDSGLKPGEFPLGSEKSRAAARAMLEAREAESQENQVILRVMRADRELALSSDECVQILRECHYLPVGPCGVVDLGHIPDGLNAEELERYLRKHGASLCGPRMSESFLEREQ
jgi:hypothetical protein